MYLWWSLCTLYLYACQVKVTIGDSGLCCCTCVMCFERQLTPLGVDSTRVHNKTLQFFEFSKHQYVSGCMPPGVGIQNKQQQNPSSLRIIQDKYICFFGLGQISFIKEMKFPKSYLYVVWVLSSLKNLTLAIFQHLFRYERFDKFSSQSLPQLSSSVLFVILFTDESSN